MNAPATPEAIVQFVPLANLYPSATNPRKHFDKKKMEELTDSVKAHGVLQPILVRPGLVANKYEIVAGERRYRAAKAAGRDEMPVMIRDLTDLQVLEIQVVENLQRDGLHELEEAEGYERLMTEHGYSADEIAAKVNKSKAYVYGRLKLCALATPEPRASFAAGKFNASIALLLARIPVADLQRQAAKEILESRHNDAMSYRDAVQHLQENYMLRLDQANFDTGAADLLPAAGACGPCPKRTGNQKELFPDVKSADICTDPKCFAAKKAAHMEKLRKDHEARGHKVFTGEAAKKLKPHRYSDVGGGYVGLDDSTTINNSYTKWRQALGKAAPETALLIDPEDGKVIEIVRRDQALEVLKDKGKTLGYQSGRGSGGADREREKKARLETAYNQQIFDAIREKPIKLGSDELAMIAVAHWERLHYEGQKQLAELYGWEYRGGDDAEKKIAAMDDGQLARFLLDCTLAPEIKVNTYSYSSRNENNNLETIARKLGIDTAAIKKTLLDEKKAKDQLKKDREKKRKAKEAQAKKVAKKPAAAAPAKEVAPKTKAAKKASKATTPATVPPAPVPIRAPDAWPFPVSTKAAS